MPRFALSLAAAGVVGIALVTAGIAQESPTRPADAPSSGTNPQTTAQPDSASDQPTPAQTTPADAITPPVTTADGLQADTQRGAFLRASSFIGLPVQGLGDARLGTVGDILIDPRTYELRYVLIDTGPGVGSHGLPIIPWALFHVSPAGPVNQGTLMVPLSIDRLAQAPTTTLAVNALAGNSAWIRDVDNFYALDLSVRRVSRPELDVEAEARSRNVQGAATTPPGAADRRETVRERMQQRRDAAQNRLRSRAGARTPGSVDPDRNRGPATHVPGATDNIGRNRGPSTTTPGSVDDAGRNRGPATTAPGSVDNAGRNRGPTSPQAPPAGGSGASPSTGSSENGTSGSGTSNTPNSASGSNPSAGTGTSAGASGQNSTP